MCHVNGLGYDFEESQTYIMWGHNVRKRLMMKMNLYKSIVKVCGKYLSGISFQRKYISQRKTSVPFYKHRLILIPAWISNHKSGNVLDEITYPLPNFNGCIVEIREGINNFIPDFIMCDYLSMLGLKLIHVSKSVPISLIPYTNLYDPNLLIEIC